MDEDENPKQIGAIQKYVKAQPKSIQSKADFQNFNQQGVQSTYNLQFSFPCCIAVIAVFLRCS